MILYRIGAAGTATAPDISLLAWPCLRCDVVVTAEAEGHLNILDRLVLGLLKVNRYSETEIARMTHLDVSLIKVILWKLETGKFISADLRVLSEPIVADVELECSVFVSSLFPTGPGSFAVLGVGSQAAADSHKMDARKRDNVLLFRSSLSAEEASLPLLSRADCDQPSVAALKKILEKFRRADSTAGRVVALHPARSSEVFVEVAVRWVDDSGRFEVLQPGTSETSVDLTMELSKVLAVTPSQAGAFVELRRRRFSDAVRVSFEPSGDLLARAAGWDSEHDLGGQEVATFYRELTSALQKSMLAAYPAKTLRAAAAMDVADVVKGIATLGLSLPGAAGRLSDPTGHADDPDASLLTIVGHMLRLATLDQSHHLRMLQHEPIGAMFLELVLRLHERSRGRAHGSELDFLPSADVQRWKSLLPRLVEPTSPRVAQGDRLVIHEPQIASREVAALFPLLGQPAFRSATFAQIAFLRVREGESGAVPEFVEQACASVQVAVAALVSPTEPPANPDFCALAKRHGFRWTESAGGALLRVRPFNWQGALRGQQRMTLGGAVCAFLISPVDGAARSLASRMPDFLTGVAELDEVRGHRVGRFVERPAIQARELHLRWVEILQSLSGAAHGDI